MCVCVCTCVCESAWVTSAEGRLLSRLLTWDVVHLGLCGHVYPFLASGKVQEGERPSEAERLRGVETPMTSPWPLDRPEADPPRRDLPSFFFFFFWDLPSWAKLAWAVSLLLTTEGSEQ